MVKTRLWTEKFEFELENPSIVRTAVGVCVFALATAAAANLRIPLPFSPVPITGQTAVVLLAGATLGAGGGAASQLLYILAGLAGLPVSAAAGPTLTGATVGYLIGFVPAAAVVGLATGSGFRLRILVPAMITASLIIYGLGVAGLMMTTRVSLSVALATGVTPFLPGDTVKIAAAVGLSRFAIPFWRQHRGRREPRPYE